VYIVLSCGTVSANVTIDINADPGLYYKHAISDDGKIRMIVLLEDDVFCINEDGKFDRDFIITTCIGSENDNKIHSSASFDGNGKTITAKTVQCSVNGDLKNVNFIAAPPKIGRILDVKNNISNVNIVNLNFVEREAAVTDGKNYLPLIVATSVKNSTFDLNARYTIPDRIKKLFIVDTYPRDKPAFENPDSRTYISTPGQGEKCHISGVHVKNTTIESPDNYNLHCLYVGLYSFGSIVDSIIDVAYFGRDGYAILSLMNVCNSHVNLVNGDPTGDSVIYSYNNYYYSIFDYSQYTGIFARCHIDSCSVRGLHSKEVCGMYCLEGGVTNARLSDLGNCNNVSDSEVTGVWIEWSDVDVKNIYLFDISGKKDRVHSVWGSMGSFFDPEDVYAVNIEGTEHGVEHYKVSNYDNPTSEDDSKCIMLRIESNLAMQLNARGTESNKVSYAASYMSDRNLGKMPHGFEYYQSYMAGMKYNNTNSLVKSYDLSRLTMVCDYDDYTLSLRPSFDIKFKDHIDVNTSESSETDPSNEPVMLNGCFVANEDGDEEDAIAFFSNHDAYTEGWSSYVNEEYQRGFGVIVNNGKILFNIRFLTPQTAEKLDDYFKGLLASIDSASEKHNIGKVPISVYYEYPQSGSINPLPSWFSPQVVTMFGADTNDAASLGHINLKVRPLTGNTVICFITDLGNNVYTVIRSSICGFAETADKTIYAITCGHGYAKTQSMEQSGIRMNSSGDPVVISDRNTDYIGEICAIINKNDADAGHIAVDASLVKIDKTIANKSNDVDSMHKTYYEDNGKVTFIETDDYKTMEDVNKFTTNTKLYLCGVKSEQINGNFKMVANVGFEGITIDNCVIINNLSGELGTGDSGGPVYVTEPFLIFFKKYKLVGLSCMMFEIQNTDKTAEKCVAIIPIENVLKELAKQAKIDDLKLITANNKAKV
jgi:hypothetical protein